jgi:carbonic anhydrase
MCVTFTATPPGTRPSDGRPSPAEALAELLAGNERFAAGRPHYGHHVSAAAAASGDQRPYAVVLGCIDSRVPLEAVFDQNFGAICVVRSGGQVLDRAVLGSIEFAVNELGVPLVVVLGHERCGAIASTIAALRAGARAVGNTAYLVQQIAPAVAEAGLDRPDAQPRALRAHLRRTVRRLEGVELLAEATRAGRVGLVGAIYDLDTGRVALV